MRYKPFTYMQTGVSGSGSLLNLVITQDFNGGISNLDYTGSLIGFIDVTGSRIQDLEKVSNNSYVVGGNFSTIGGIARSKIAKIINNNVDTSGGWGGAGFIEPIGVQSAVQVVLKQRNTGKFIVKASVGGGTYNGTTVSEYFRLNSDGTYDPTYGVSSSVADVLNSIILDSEDNLWIGGTPNSLTINGVAYTKGIAKFDPDGNPISLISGSGFSPTNSSITSLSNDGTSIFVGGSFTSYNGSSVGRGIIKLNSDGSVDSSFNVGTGMSGSLVQTNGLVKHLPKINRVALCSPGSMVFYSGSAVNDFALIKPDGTLDTNFYIPTGSTSYEAAKRDWIDNDNQGNFYLCNVNSFDGVNYNTTSSQSFIKLDSTGSVAIFDYNNIKTGLSQEVFCLQVWG